MLANRLRKDTLLGGRAYAKASVQIKLEFQIVLIQKCVHDVLAGGVLEA